MNEDFQKISDKLPEILTRFEQIQSSTTKATQVMRAITETLQKEADLYFAVMKIVKEDFLVLDSVFCKYKEDTQYYSSHWDTPINLSESEFAAKLESGDLLIGSEEQVTLLYFCSAPFPLMTSWIFLPIKRQGKVFGVIELGSEKTISPSKLNEDSNTAKAFRLPFEVLLSKINEIVDSRLEND